MPNRKVTRRKFLRGAGASAAFGLAGCKGDDPDITPTNEKVDTDSSTETTTQDNGSNEEIKTDEQTETQTDTGIEKLLEEDERLQNVEDVLEGEDFEAFADRTVSEEGKYTDEGERTVEYLSKVREDIDQSAFEATTSSIVEVENFEKEHVDLMEFWLNTEDQDFREEVFQQGIRDSDGDGLYDGEEQYFGLEETELGSGEEQVSFIDLVKQLRVLGEKEGFTKNDLEYLNTVSEYVENKDHPYLQWQQAKALDRKEDAPDVLENAVVAEDNVPRIDDETIEAVKLNKQKISLLNAPERILINGIKEEVEGFDPEKTASGGDGIPDGHKLYMKEVQGWDFLNYGEPDVLCELSRSQEVVNPIKDEVLNIVKEDHPANVHFFDGKISPSTGSDIDVRTKLPEIRDGFGEKNEEYSRFVYVTDHEVSVYGKDYDGFALGSEQSFLIDVTEEDGGERMKDIVNIASLIEHELGHLCGISSSLEWVDDYVEINEDDPSVMNYNVSGDKTGYSERDKEVMEKNDYEGIELNGSGVEEMITNSEDIEIGFWKNQLISS